LSLCTLRTVHTVCYDEIFMFLLSFRKLLHVLEKATVAVYHLDSSHTMDLAAWKIQSPYW